MDVSNLWTAWPISGPWLISPLSGGTNKFMQRADAADGQSYILRLSTDLTRVPHMRYEAELLQALSEKVLPFRLPLPLRVNSGDYIVLFEQEQGTDTVATLSPLLPGTQTQRPSKRIACRINPGPA